MYEKQINLIDVRFIFIRKLASRECVLQGPQMLKIIFGGPNVPGYMAQDFFKIKK